MDKLEYYVGGGIMGIGTLGVFIIAPIETLIVLVVTLGIGGGVLAFLKWFGVLAPLYVQTTQIAQNNQTLLTDSRHRFEERVKAQIQTLPMNAQGKSNLYKFVLDSENTLKKILLSEKIPCFLSDVRFGALTVTYQLKLREFSRANLDKLMKLEDLIAQALSVESVRLIQGSGFIDCEVSSPMRVPVDLKLLEANTNGSNVAIGLDSTLRPAQIDIAQHGLIAAIAPSRRGKTQAIRTTLYLLKRADPSLNIVVVAFKSADWQAFKDCATLIYDAQELKQFQTWLLAEMYRKAKSPDKEKWVIVFDDLVNLLATNPELTESIKQFASLGAGVGITTIVSTQFSGKDSGGTATFANATARLLFKPSSNLQGSRDGGMAGLGLDQLSNQKGDALLVVDGDPIRITTALTNDSLISTLTGAVPERDWLSVAPNMTQPVTALQLHPMETLIEKLNGWLLEENVFDWETGKFTNRSEAMRRLDWTPSGRARAQLSELEEYIFQNASK